MRVVALCALLGCGFSSQGDVTRSAPPPNDDYLFSTKLEPSRRAPGGIVEDLQDTTEATVQADLFMPPRSNGGPENTRCGGAVFGRTVWYDFRLDRHGVAELRTAGFDAVAAVYRVDPATKGIIRLMRCADSPGTAEDVFVPVRRGRAYAVQLGGADRGAGPESGRLHFTFEFFADRDRDDIFDELDTCPRQPGVREAGGCPPALRPTVRLRWSAVAPRIVVTELKVGALPRGTRVELECVRRCKFRDVVRARRRTVVLRRIVGQVLPTGARFELRVTKGPSGQARYRFGAVGSYFRYEVRRGDVRRIARCLPPGSTTPKRRCT